MLNFESFVHRDELAHLISRWMVDQPAKDDVQRLKELLNFNFYLSRIWLDELAVDLLTRFYGSRPRFFSFARKGELKDFAVDHPPYTNARIEEMRSKYKKFPEDFYRETPVDGSFYAIEMDGRSYLAASSRIKRARRIADKGSRRVVDFMLTKIRANADILAEERARQLGIPKDRLITTQAEMVKEFEHAERRLIKSIKRGTIQAELPMLSLPDVVGLKVIVEDEESPRMLQFIGATPGCAIEEVERHDGNYKALNLRVRTQIPKTLLRSRPPSGRYLDLLRFRGVNLETVSERYQEFINAAEDTVMFEIIVSSYQEFLESEVGRSMHETRVASQRSHPEYNGHLATNVRSLLAYILELGRASSTPTLDALPIKLWVKYMPDTVELNLRRLYLPDELFFGAFDEHHSVMEEQHPSLMSARNGKEA